VHLDRINSLSTKRPATVCCKSTNSEGNSNPYVLPLPKSAAGTRAWSQMLVVVDRPQEDLEVASVVRQSCRPRDACCNMALDRGLKIDEPINMKAAAPTAKCEKTRKTS